MRKQLNRQTSKQKQFVGNDYTATVKECLDLFATTTMRQQQKKNNNNNKRWTPYLSSYSSPPTTTNAPNNNDQIYPNSTPPADTNQQRLQVQWQTYFQKFLPSKSSAPS